jgi:hypothetical protein
MVKLRHKGLLVLGTTRHEMQALLEGRPLDIPLGDLHPSLKGQRILVIPGEDNAQLERIMQMVAAAYENGATSPLAIAQSLPTTMKRPN